MIITEVLQQMLTKHKPTSEVVNGSRMSGILLQLLMMVMYLNFMLTVNLSVKKALEKLMKNWGLKYALQHGETQIGIL